MPRPLRWNQQERVAPGRSRPYDQRAVNRILHEIGFSLQADRKTVEGRQHPDRDAQFGRISERVKAFVRLGQPAISVDAKEKELVGDCRNGGREWHRAGEVPRADVHDFSNPELQRLADELGLAGLGLPLPAWHKQVEPH